MSAHAVWAPSSFSRRIDCPGSYVLEHGAPDRETEDAARGTAAHQVLTWALKAGRPAAAYLGEVIDVGRFSFTVHADMAERVQSTIDWLSTSVEQVMGVDDQVNFAEDLMVPADDGWGTLDVCAAQGSTLVVLDYKDGYVPVDVGTPGQPNAQLALYALGALKRYEAAGPWDKVLLVIAQPRISTEPSTVLLELNQLRKWLANLARPAVMRCLTALDERDVPTRFEQFLHPGEDQCRFCAAKASCPAIRGEVTSTVMAVKAATPDEFTAASVAPTVELSTLDPKWLAAGMAKVELIEDWCKAIRAETERRLLAGTPLEGWKLVKGRQGNRAWTNEADVEAMLTKTFRLPKKVAFELKLISPTTAEKLHKAKLIGEEQYAKLKTLVSRSEGGLHVAPVSDKRPAILIGSASGDFEPVPDPNDYA